VAPVVSVSKVRTDHIFHFILWGGTLRRLLSSAVLCRRFCWGGFLIFSNELGMVHCHMISLRLHQASSPCGFLLRLAFTPLGILLSLFSSPKPYSGGRGNCPIYLICYELRFLSVLSILPCSCHGPLFLSVVLSHSADSYLASSCDYARYSASGTSFVPAQWFLGRGV
jgi:hypothetical protein